MKFYFMVQEPCSEKMEVTDQMCKAYKISAMYNRISLIGSINCFVQCFHGHFCFSPEAVLL